MCEKAGDHLPHRSGDEKWDLGFFLGVRVWRREVWKWNISGVRKGRWSVKGPIMGKDVRMFTEFWSITIGSELLELLHRLT